MLGGFTFLPHPADVAGELASSFNPGAASNTVVAGCASMTWAAMGGPAGRDFALGGPRRDGAKARLALHPGSQRGDKGKIQITGEFSNEDKCGELREHYRLRWVSRLLQPKPQARRLRAQLGL
jgi:hypothetical protein